MNLVKDMFMAGIATKEVYKEALVGFRDATEGMKSPKREEAKASYTSVHASSIRKLYNLP